MNATKNISPWQFAVFRIVFGVYLFWHFAALIPYAGELFSNRGVLPRAEINFTYRAFPNLLAWADAPWQAQIFLAVLALAALAFAAGWRRRTCALFLWYGWACLFNRNNLISNPGIPYVGVLLVFCAIIPKGEPLSWRTPRDTAWKMPAFVFWGAWFLMALGYTYSGAWKWMSPSWQDGSGLWHLLTNPLARPGLPRDLLLAAPWQLLAGLTWFALLGELLFLPMSLHRKGRLLAWSWMLSMHLGILLVVDFADLTLGMLMLHLFTFDPDWFPAKKESQAILLFDGECGLCDRAVRFFSDEDAAGALRFAPLQGNLGREFLRRHHLEEIDSMVLIERPGAPEEKAHTHSTAALQALVVIAGFWRLGGLLLAIPRFLRDSIYRQVAARRYAWFGKRDAVCSLPSARLRAQMIA